MIDDRIKIVIVEIRGDKVRLGVESPKDVPVHRQEIYEAIQRAMQRNPSTEKESHECSSTG